MNINGPVLFKSRSNEAASVRTQRQMMEFESWGREMTKEEKELYEKLLQEEQEWFRRGYL